MAQGIYAARIQFAKLILQDEKRECAVCFLIIWYDKGKIEKHTHTANSVFIYKSFLSTERSVSMLALSSVCVGMRRWQMCDLILD